MPDTTDSEQVDTETPTVDSGAVEDIPETEQEWADEWVDIRMTDPEAGEWEVDTVVLDGRVQYVDLRIRPSLLASFVECLIDDVDADRAQEVLETVARRQEIDDLCVSEA